MNHTFLRKEYHGQRRTELLILGLHCLTGCRRRVLAKALVSHTLTTTQRVLRALAQVSRFCQVIDRYSRERTFTRLVLHATQPALVFECGRCRALWRTNLVPPSEYDSTLDLSLCGSLSAVGIANKHASGAIDSSKRRLSKRAD